MTEMTQEATAVPPIIRTRRRPEGEPESLLITKAEAAAMLHITERTIDRLVHDGTLKPYYIRRSVRFSRAEIYALAGLPAPGQ
jgi:excisionase family DNA binding protein